MKVFLRTFNPSINSKTGDPLPEGLSRSGAERWHAFEGWLQELFTELGCSLLVQPENPKVPDEPRDAGLRVYAHRTRRDVAGDLFYMQTHLADLFTLDTRGWGADHSRVPAPDDLVVGDSEATVYVEGLRAELLASGRSKHAQPPPSSRVQRWTRGRALPKGAILVPLQTPRDYVALHHAPLTVLELIDLVDRFARRAKTPFAIKLHPYNTKDVDIHERVGQVVEGNPHVHLVEGNIQELLSLAAGLWTINSGVGFEALIHDLPVVTFGDCDYRSATFAAREETLDQALAWTFREDPAQRALGRRLVQHYCRRHGYRLADGEGARSRLRGFLADYLASRQA